jgi:gluconolactonase
MPTDTTTRTAATPSAEGAIAYDAAFAHVTGKRAALTQLAEADAHEGPVYVAEQDTLFFTSLPRPSDAGPRVAIRRLELDPSSSSPAPGAIVTVRDPSNAANGMVLDTDGRHLLVCEQGTPTTDARIARFDPIEGTTTTVADRWEGLRLNSPNDVVVAPDGAVWFTDPSYGHLQGFRPQPEVGDFLYRVDRATGRVTVEADGFDKPNGLAFSPDGSVLYVTDSGANQEPGSYHIDRPHHVEAFDVRSGRHLADRRLFAVIAPGFPDGIKVDEIGNVYVSSPRGVRVFSPDGDALGEIAVPGAVNFDFGGRDGNVLFVTTDTAVWAAVLEIRGARSAGARA